MRQAPGNPPAALFICAHSGKQMPVKPPSLRAARSPAPRLRHDDARARHDLERKSSSARGYNARWRKARETFLARQPLCAMCAYRGEVKAAEVVDHWFPHRGDPAVFWRTEWWVPLCKTCHDGPKQSIESRGQKDLEEWFEIIRDQGVGTVSHSEKTKPV